MQDPIFDVPAAPPPKAKKKSKLNTVKDGAAPRACKWCGRTVVEGFTHLGKFTVLEPDTLKNHWISCAGRDEARAYYDTRDKR